MKNSLSKNSIFYLIYNVLNVIFPFLTAIYVARILLPADIGQVETAKNLAQYFVIFSFLGIPTYGLREISKKRSNQKELNKLYTELMVINTVSTTFFLILYFLTVFLVPAYRENFIFFLITGILVGLNYINNAWLFEGMEKFEYISIRNLFFKAVSFLFLIVFVRDSSDYLAYALITVVGTAGNYILNIITSRKIVQLDFSHLNIKQHMKSIAFLVVVNLAIEIYSLVDVTMLGLMCSKKTVAYYTYGIRIQQILLQIINTFTMVLVPRIALYYSDKKIKEYNCLLTKTFDVINILALPIVIGTFFIGGPLMTMLFGAEYYRSSIVLKILIPVICISPIGYLLGSRVMLVTGHENKMIIPVISGAIINVIGNLLFIPRFQEAGAAMASIGSEIVVATVYLILSHQFYKLDYCAIKKTISKVLISLLVMTCILSIFKGLNKFSMGEILLQTGIAAGVYFSLLLILKEPIVYSYFEIFKERLKNR